MNKPQVKTQFPVIGGSSLLVIFAVLCLTVFALLGLSTVHANKRLSDISTQAVADYYDADHRAEQILAQLRTGQIPEGGEQQGDIFRYSCPISSTLTLQVEVRSSDWTVLRWQAIPAAQWEGDDTLNLWNGQG